MTIEELQRDLKRIKKELARPQALLLHVANSTLNEIEGAFRDEKDTVNNRPWQELSPVTKAIKRRKNLSERKLVGTSGLKNSIHGRILNDTMSVGTNLPYAAIHEYGGMAGRNRKVKIPARPYMPVNKEGKINKDLEKMIEIHMDKWLDKVLK